MYFSFGYGSFFLRPALRVQRQYVRKPYSSYVLRLSECLTTTIIVRLIEFPTVFRNRTRQLWRAMGTIENGWRTGRWSRRISVAFWTRGYNGSVTARGRWRKKQPSTPYSAASRKLDIYIGRARTRRCRSGKYRLVPRTILRIRSTILKCRAVRYA